MKFLKCLSILPVALLSMHVYANPASVTVPFVNKPFPKEGLAIRYDLRGGQKIVCTFGGFYKAFVKYSDNNEMHESAPFGNDQEFYFTNRGQTINMISENLDQLHVDNAGSIKLIEADPARLDNATATCFYLPESN